MSRQKKHATKFSTSSDSSSDEMDCHREKPYFVESGKHLTGYPLLKQTNENPQIITIRSKRHSSRTKKNLKDFDEDPEFMKKQPKALLYTRIQEMLEKRQNPNVFVNYSKETIPCHKIVLDCYSKRFSELLYNESITLPQDKVPAHIFHWIYGWMLKENIDLPKDKTLEIFAAAQYLEIEDLLSVCWRKFDNHCLYAEDSAYALYLKASKLQIHQLKELMLSRVSKFFLSLVASTEFVHMEFESLKGLLSMSSIGVNSEVEVFMSLVCWLSYDWLDREKHTKAGMKCIRFSLMPPWYLSKLNAYNETSQIRKAVASSDVQKMIQDAMMFTTGLVSFGKSPEQFDQFKRIHHLKAPDPRLWIYDEMCPYHYVDVCPTMVPLHYEDFVKYLELLRSLGPEHWHTFKVLADSTFRWENTGEVYERYDSNSLN